jgi:hypothetical protein
MVNYYNDKFFKTLAINVAAVTAGFTKNDFQIKFNDKLIWEQSFLELSEKAGFGYFYNNGQIKPKVKWIKELCGLIGKKEIINENEFIMLKEKLAVLGNLKK